MNDRELLELAAKAAGLDFDPTVKNKHGLLVADRNGCQSETRVWNPLTDDGDCARMEAAIGIDVSWSAVYAMADNSRLSDCILAPYSAHNGDRQKARRRASTYAAAEIGKATA